MISQETIDEVRDRTSLLEVIGERIELTRSGSSHCGLCPFHSEKSPSFYVHEDRKYYHCFGCGASGNVITFLMKIQGLTFPEAVETLAARYQIDVKREGEKPRPRKGPDPRKLVRRVNEIALEYFREAFLRAPDTVMRYAEKRGLSPSLQEEFCIGYSECSWHGLTSYLKARDVTEEAALLSGLVRRNKRGELYDLFRGRLIFPIRGYAGEVVAFGGRLIPGLFPDEEESKSPKYINSPESVIYKKSEVLYGFFEHLAQIRDTAEVLLVEGYLDVIGLHRVGVCNAVATCGTATTEKHVRRLARFAKKIFVVFDGDNAGRVAAAKCFELFLNSGVDVQAIFLPDGEDPDSISAKHSNDTLAYFSELERHSLLKLYIAELIRAEGAGSAEELGAASKGRVGKQLARTLSKIENSIERNELSRQAAFALLIEAEELFGFIEKIISGEAADSGSEVRDESAADEQHNTADEPTHSLGAITPVEKLHRVQRELLFAVMAHKEVLLERVLADADVCPQLDTSTRLFLEGLHQILFSDGISEARKRSLTLTLLKSFGPTWMALWKKAYKIRDEGGVNLLRQFEDCCLTLRRGRIRDSLMELTRQISRCEDDERKAYLVHEKVLLERRVRDLAGD